MRLFRNWVWWVAGRWPLGYSHDLVLVDGKPYLERRIIWLLRATLRWHTFWRGDQERHPHDHPWNFITFPLAGYWELVEEDFEYVLHPGITGELKYVKPFRFHYRPAGHRHIVRDPGRPIHTLVLTGGKINDWGFWVDGTFVPHRQYPRGEEQ